MGSLCAFRKADKVVKSQLIIWEVLIVYSFSYFCPWVWLQCQCLVSSIFFFKFLKCASKGHHLIMNTFNSPGFMNLMYLLKLDCKYLCWNWNLYYLGKTKHCYVDNVKQHAMDVCTYLVQVPSTYSTNKHFSSLLKEFCRQFPKTK